GSTDDNEGPRLRAAASIALGRHPALPSPQSGRLDVIICVRGGTRSRGPCLNQTSNLSSRFCRRSNINHIHF
ncbi:unnamed protein product, partial [Musa textilis]